MGGLFWTREELDLTFATQVAPSPDALNTCIQCGSCTAGCPTANRMTVTPNRMARLLRLGMKEEVLDSRAFWLCTSCGACTSHCPRGIGFLETIIGLKRYAIEKGLHIPEDVRLLQETIRSTHNISGDPNDERLGWSTNLPQPLTGLERKPDADVLYFVGCISAFYPRAYSIPQAFGRILDVADVSFTTLAGDEWCCGYPLYNAGLEAEITELVEHNVRQIEALGVTTMVTTCPSCYYMWKVVYPRFTTLPTWLSIVHGTRLLADLLDERKIRPGILSRVVTYHDPCDLARKSGEHDSPRHLLASLPGVEFREMANIRDNALCCGGGGDVKIFSHETTMEVARRRVQQALDVEADTIVTACQQCKRALVGAIQQIRQPMRVVDVSELVWETLLHKVEW